MENNAKKCIVCGNTYTLDHFRRTPLAPDGYAKTCKECATVKRQQGLNGDRNPELMKYQVRELIDELRARGYAGTLKIPREVKV